MKKLFVMAALALGVTVVSAQKTTTPWFVGGNAEVSAAKLGDAKQARVSLAPQVGYMFNESWGVAVNLKGAYSTNYQWSDRKEVGFGAGASLLHNVKITDKFFYIPALNVGFEMSHMKTGGVKFGETTSFGASVDFLKFEFRPSCHWGLNFDFGEARLTSSKVKGAKDSTLSGDLNLTNTAVGFRYYF